MATTLAFLQDPYRVETEALVLSRRGDHLVLDRSVFFPGIGVSPADRGSLVLGDLREVKVRRSHWRGDKSGILEHSCEDLPDQMGPGSKVVAKIDWIPRYAAMRVHTALHLVSVALPYPMIDERVDAGRGSVTFSVDVTGVGAGELESVLRDLVRRNLPVEAGWIPPPLHDLRLNTRSFEWPGSSGHVRAIKIGAIDQQPCDGLHVRSTGEVGEVRITDLRQIHSRRYRCELRVLETG